jgi:hypothetical protein
VPDPPDPLRPDLLFMVCAVAQLVAALTAVAVARVRREHRAVALFLAVQVVANGAHRALRLAVLEPARTAAAGAPFTGGVRAVGHVVTALGLTWPVGLAALAVAVLLRRRVWPAVVLWLVVSMMLAITYPTTRGPVLARALLACELAAVVVVLGAIVSWWRTPERLHAHVEHARSSCSSRARRPRCRSARGERISSARGPWLKPSTP